MSEEHNEREEEYRGMEAYTERICRRLIVGMGFALWVSTGLSSRCEAKDLTEVLSQGLSVPSVVFSDFDQGVGNAIAPGIASGIAQAVTQEFPQAAVSPAFTFRYNPILTVY